jgi:hypothetical protein
LPEQYQVTKDSYQNQMQPVEKVQAEVINPIKLEATDLINKYNTKSYDELKDIDTQYKNKYLEVTGTVESISDNKLVLENDNNDKWYSEWMGVKCCIENQQEQAELQQIQVGDEVIITGTCKGLDGMSVQMSDCYIGEMIK